MEPVALYRKYRSRTFEELIGQEHVARTLSAAIEGGRINHAYLFTGPRGTGKTSAARILARQVNRQDAEVADGVDIIEIDAASNNGVDEIRELREKVHVAPNYQDYKVYIIDEVHMLSTAAFNALLKTLEEPPSHAIFILATTEPHKLPQTVISRTQHFPFRLVATQTLTRHLGTIAASEGIEIEDEALELLGHLAEGSVRDGLSLLDQLTGSRGGAITIEDVRAMIGIAHHEQLQELLELVLSQQPAGVVDKLDEIYATGVSARQLLKQLVDTTRLYVRDRISSEVTTAQRARQVLQMLTAIPAHSMHLETALEAGLLEAAWTSTQEGLATKAAIQADTTTDTHSKDAKAAQETSKTSESGASATTKIQKTKSKQTNSKKAKQKPSSKRTTTHTDSAQQPTAAASDPDTVWIDTLSRIKNSHVSLYGLLRNVEVEMTETTCRLSARFQFHYRRLQHAETKAAITEALTAAGGGGIELIIEQRQAQTPRRLNETTSEMADEAETQNATGQVLDILGGEIV